MAKSDETPMMKQYWSVKERFPGKILFFRMGDFYEMFHDDAKIASKVLGLALTSRAKGDGAVPMAGVPYHSADTYIRRLIKAGHNIAICEQVEDAAAAKGLVERDVVQVVTPGTYTDEKFLEDGANNYLMAVVPGEPAGLSWADLSTGEFFISETMPGEVAGEISRIGPSELLVAESVSEKEPVFAELLDDAAGGFSVVPRPDWEFDAQSARRSLAEHFGTSGLGGFGAEDYSAGVRAAGAVLEYLKETQKGALGQMRSIRPVERAGSLVIDRNALRALELVETQRAGEREGSLLSVMDTTRTAMGSRLIRSWLLSPLARVDGINARLEAVSILRDDQLSLDRYRNLLGGMADLSRLAARVASGRGTPRDVVGVAKALKVIPEIKAVRGNLGEGLLSGTVEGLEGLEEIRQLIDNAIVENPPPNTAEGGIIRKGYSEELDELVSLKKEGRKWIADFQAREAERTGVKTLKVGYNKVFGYYVEITNANKDRVPEDYVRKQTLKNSERYITEELKDHEEKVLRAIERAVAMEQELFAQVREEVAGHTSELQANADLLAALDVLCAFAYNAAQGRYVRPEVDDSRLLEVSDGRHPVLEGRVEFVPNDTLLDTDENRLLVITGPNMAGKSTYIRQVALLVIMAQMGSFVPADSMKLGYADRICTRVGASDDLVRGKSTFMVEMNETANILNNATDRSIVVLDEVGRGTSTYDGLSLGWAVAEHVARRLRSRTLFATHYHQLTDLAHTCEGVKNYNVAVREWGDKVVFLHKIVEGASDRSYGIHVARLAGIPREVIERAVVILANLEAGSADGADMPKLLPREERARDAQLALFEDPEEKTVKKLREVDINLTTPVEALNILKEILEMLD